MKFSIVNGERREAEKGLLGICIGCGEATIPKCGTIKVWHWAHKSSCNCDHWWENETEWHRSWKNSFPSIYQEIRHRAESGEWHIADVKTAQNWVLEFQNSPISLEERDARNAFYRTVTWIVNGSRLTRDRVKFFKDVENGIKICDQPHVTKIFSPESSLFGKWSNCRAPVFFDFKDDPSLWCVYPNDSNSWQYVAPISREDFIEFHQGSHEQLQGFLGFLQNFSKVISTHLAHIQRQQQLSLQRQILLRPPTRFERQLARRRAFRRL